MDFKTSNEEVQWKLIDVSRESLFCFVVRCNVSMKRARCSLFCWHALNFMSVWKHLLNATGLDADT